MDKYAKNYRAIINVPWSVHCGKVGIIKHVDGESATLYIDEQFEGRYNINELEVIDDSPLPLPG